MNRWIKTMALALAVGVAAPAALRAEDAPDLQDLERRLEAAKREEAEKVDAARRAAAERAEAERRRADELAEAERRRAAESAREATLVVRSDAPCQLSLDGVASGDLAAGTPRSVTLPPGQLLLQCTSTEESQVQYEEVITAQPGAKTVHGIRLAELVAKKRGLPVAGNANATVRMPPAPGEEQAYQQAYELVRARRFGEATTAFEYFTSKYPNGMYAGNAHYWLGELYLLDGDAASAKKHFETLLQQFGDNRRVPDAMFKLGRIYHQEGDAGRAKFILERVVSEYAASDSTAPKLAREYLQKKL